MSDDPDEQMREYARALFAADEDETGTWGRRGSANSGEPEAPGNHVPREGNNPTGGKSNDDMRTFAAELFSRALRD